MILWTGYYESDGTPIWFNYMTGYYLTHDEVVALVGQQ